MLTEIQWRLQCIMRLLALGCGTLADNWGENVCCIVGVLFFTAVNPQDPLWTSAWAKIGKYELCKLGVRGCKKGVGKFCAVPIFSPRTKHRKLETLGKWAHSRIFVVLSQTPSPALPYEAQAQHRVSRGQKNLGIVLFTPTEGIRVAPKAVSCIRILMSNFTVTL